MADSYSVKAILSAADKGFTSTLKSAHSAVTGLAKTIGSGMFMGVGMAAFNALAGGAKSMISEIDSSNAAWQNFESNLSMLEWKPKAIDSAKKDLQEFAQQTVYSSSDMATTFSQLAAVGVKDTTELVKGFGGLAAAAENPQQAMKTLSTQATQMAAKPSVAWADFKLMLEQTPAGIAAVAREMGMSTSELVTAVQDGKVSTEDFFDAIKKAGGSGTELAKLATKAKTVGQAMDGLKETVGNKLTPAFDVFSKLGIKAVEGLTDKLAGIDASGLADKVTGWIKKAQPYWESFKKAVSKVWSVISGVGEKLAPIFQSIGETAASAFKGLLDSVAGIDAGTIVDKISSGIDTATQYWEAFQTSFEGVGSALGDAFGALKDSLGELLGGFEATDGLETFKSIMETVADSIKAIAGFIEEHSDTIVRALPYIAGLVGAFKAFKVVQSVAPFVQSFTGAIGGLAKKGIGGIAGKLFGISKSQDEVGKKSSSSSKQMLAAAKATMMMGAAVLMVAAGFALLAYSAIALSSAGGLAIGVFAGMAIAMAGLMIGMMAMMKTMTASPAKLAKMATAMLALGVAVLLVAAGFALLAFASISLANAGGLAIGVMVGMVAVIALFAVGAAALAPALTAGAVGLIAFGAAMVLVGVAAILAATAIVIISTALPTLATYGLQGAVAIAALGAAMMVFAAGAALAGAAAIVLGAGLIVVATGLSLVGVAVMICAAGVLLLAAGVIVLAAGAMVLGAGLMVCGAALTMMGAAFPMAAAGALAAVASFTLLLAMATALAAILLVLNAPLLLIGGSALVAAAGITAFGAGMSLAAAGSLVMAAGLKAVNSSMKSIAKNAKSAEKSLSSMQDSVSVVESGLNALGSKAKSAMNKLTSAFNNAASKAKSAGKKVGTGFTTGMQSGLAKAPAIAMVAVAAATGALMGGYGRAYSAGAYISQGFAAGMLSCLAMIRSAAAQMAAEADAAVRAKAKIHSPSKVSAGLGEYWGEGFVNGITSMARDAWKAAANLVSVPNLATPNLAMAYSGEMGAEYDYYRNSEYVVSVPLSVDGREFAKATATYTQNELDKRQMRSSRKHGKA